MVLFKRSTAIKVLPTYLFFSVSTQSVRQVGGLEGAHNIGKVMAERHIKLEFILDEGLPVTDGIIPGVEVPVAM